MPQAFSPAPASATSMPLKRHGGSLFGCAGVPWSCRPEIVAD
jgi:hypothetical protein